MNTIGRHLLAELYGCDPVILDDIEGIRRNLLAAAEVIGANVVGATFHRFAPQGVSGVIAISESHLSIHTWPERGYVAVDIYTCGLLDPVSGFHCLAKSLKASSYRFHEIQRGLPEDFESGGPPSHGNCSRIWQLDSISDLSSRRSAMRDSLNNGIEKPVSEQRSQNVGVGAAVIVWQDRAKHRLLLGLGHSAESRNAVYAVPGGHWEPGESLLETARREAAEEAGIEVEELHLVSVYEFFNPEKQKNYITLGFEGFLAGGEPKVMEPDKKVNWGWFSPEAALALPLFAPDKVLIQRVVSGQLYEAPIPAALPAIAKARTV